MGIKNCEIHLDNPWNTYYAGQVLSGNLKISFDKPKKVQAITIRFKGEAKTKWSESRSVRGSDGKYHQRTHTQTGQEEYFKSKVNLVGGDGTEVELAPGTYDYAFSFQLPLTIPSSFEGDYGHVRYTIKVTLDRPWKFDQDMLMAFTIITPVDLNMTPQLNAPANLQMHKTFCCLWCKSGPLAVNVSIPVTGYVSGQAIPITCECDNASKVDIDEIKFALYKNVSFTTTDPHYAKKSTSTKIAKLSVGPVLRYNSQTYQRQLEVPVLPATNLLYCGLMSIDYVLQIECKVSGFHKNLSGNIPITLGTIPLASFVSPAPTHIDPTQLETQALNSASPATGTGGAIGWNIGDAPPRAMFPDLPPPIFSETAFRAPELRNEDEDTEHTRILGEVNYAPRYPTFQYPTFPPLPPSAPSAPLVDK